MPCTTLLVGKNASYDGSTMIARNDDSGGGHFTPKKFVAVKPEDQPRVYTSVLSHVTVELPDHPLRYTAIPNAVKGEGIWAAAGVNSENVAMTATETITSNARVLGADPLVVYREGTKEKEEQIGGIGEEDIVVLVLPYIHSARDGVKRLGSLLERYGTWEMNGIAFQDVNEIWWLETIGGHHWIASRVPDDRYVVMPNQFGTDHFDLEDALGGQKNYMCSADLKAFISENHLDLSLDGKFNPREAFGSHADSDHIYNTPRAWFIERYLNPHTFRWDGPDADYTPESDDIPFSLVPERKITVEDAKYVLSAHYQGTPFDPYGSYGDPRLRGKYRSVGVNRTDFLSLTQMRPYVPEAYRAVEWIAFGSNVFNAFVPCYANVNRTPEYLSCTTGEVTTESFYWASRLIGALADASYAGSLIHIERYQLAVQAAGQNFLHRFDAEGNGDLPEKAESRVSVNERANEEMARVLKEKTEECLDHVLFEASSHMKNAFARSDA